MKAVAFFILNKTMIFKNNATQKWSSVLLIAAFIITPIAGQSQTVHDNPQQVRETVLKKDSQFWSAYNKCDVIAMTSFVTSDLEFYHDKSGLTEGLETFKKSIETGLCANGPQLKRVIKKGSVEVFPLNGRKVFALKGAPIFGQTAGYYFKVEGSEVVQITKRTLIYN